MLPALMGVAYPSIAVIFARVEYHCHVTLALKSHKAFDNHTRRWFVRP
jgi:hypothetical protein